MSVEQFKAKERRDRWVKKWREWSAVDDKLVNVESWGYALSLMSKFCGLQFEKIATNQSDYIDRVVKEVIRILGGDPGRDRLCQMVDDMYKKAASNRFYIGAASTSATNSGLVGIHGFAGLGKTTLCKWLCDWYRQELGGRVCYIDVGSSPASPEQKSAAFRGRLQHMLSSLSPGNNANGSQLSIYQFQSLLRDEFSSMKGPVFLAIDSIQSKSEQEEAVWYLGCNFPEGSKIFITSKSEGILANLGSQHKCSFSEVTAYMPRLTFAEARDIFLQELSKLHKFGLTNQQKDDVNECVNLCTIHWVRYHPLMLKAVADAFIKGQIPTRYFDWKRGIKDDVIEGQIPTRYFDWKRGIKDDVWMKVFNVFEISYKSLTWRARQVFLDLAVFYSIAPDAGHTHKWINMLHSCNTLYPHLGRRWLEEDILQLEDVCFIERKGFGNIGVTDVLVDFAKFKTRDELEIEYVVMDAITRRPNLDHLSSWVRYISICKAKLQTQQLDLRDVHRVKVLHLVDNAELQKVLLSPITCADLSSLIVTVPKFTTLCCTLDEDYWQSLLPRRRDGDYWRSLSPRRRGGPFQSLNWMQLRGNVYFQQYTGASGHLSDRKLLTGLSDANFHSLTKLEMSKAADPVSILGGLSNLKVLDLCDLPNVLSIDLTTCANLNHVTLQDMPSLKFIHGLDGNSQHLRNVDITGSSTGMNFNPLTVLEISKAADLGCLRNLEVLHLKLLPKVQSIDLTTCANLKDAVLSNMPSLKLIHGLEENSYIQIADCKRPSGSNIFAISGAHISVRDCPSLEPLSFLAACGSQNMGSNQSESPQLEQSPLPQSSTYCKPNPLNLQRKVFLCHSGRDKEFVRHLQKALCNSYHGIEVTFFDEDSIPKGEAVNMENILGEARTSELCVLVLTNDFFTYTQNPMLELEAFLAAEVKLLPLFLTMSVEQFKAKEQRDRWVKKWREWAAVDDKLVNLESWGQALSLLSEISGLEFCKIAANLSDYIDEVVKQVTRIIGGRVIHGKDRLCEGVDESRLEIIDEEMVPPLYPSHSPLAIIQREDASCSQIIEEENPEVAQELPSHRQKLTLKESDLQGFKFEEFINLRKLKLQYCLSIERLPLDIFCLYSLRVLKLHGCSSLQELPMEMGRLTALESLDVYACGKLKGLPESLSRLTLLEELSLCECTTLEALPDAMGKLSALKTLHIAGCENLSNLPDSTSKLVSLVQLELQGCGMLMELPSGMGYLNNLHALTGLGARARKQLELKVLNLDDCSRVRRLPRKLGNFKKLRILSLANCHGLKALSSGICDLHSLVVLDLQGCSELQKLPGKFGMHLRALESLYLMECQSLRGLPSRFCRLKVLTELDMTGCAKLEWLPPQMGSLKALRKLKLAYCKSLHELPDSICKLGALVVMDVHGCHKLRELPAKLGKLGKLEILDLRSCKRLGSFPPIDGASELQSLRELDLRWSLLESHLEIKVADKGDLYFLGPEKVKNFFKLWSGQPSHMGERQS